MRNIKAYPGTPCHCDCEKKPRKTPRPLWTRDPSPWAQSWPRRREDDEARGSRTIMPEDEERGIWRTRNEERRVRKKKLEDEER